jgi:hypothetical protein
MARRYTKSLTMPAMATVIQSYYEEAGNITADGLRTLRPHRAWIRMAPSRYSRVRKVIFHCALQWFENNPARNVDIRLMVGPMSSSQTTRVIEAVEFPLASIVRRVPTSSAPWAWEPSNPINPTFMDDQLYAKRGVQDTINGHYNGVATEGDVHMFRIEFDRFDGLSDDFFADWDSVAELGNDDAYVAYNIYPGIVESTFVAGTARNIHSVSVGCHVVQAPGPENNTCTVLPIGRFGFYTTNLALIRRTAFSVHPDGHSGRWAYDADEWDGITQIAAWHHSSGNNMAAGNFYRYRVDSVPGPTEAIAVLDQQNFNNSSQSTFIDVVRSADIFPLLNGGEVIGGDYLFEGPIENTQAPLQQLEIIQKSTTRTVFYISLGRGKSNWPADETAAYGHGFFNPLFFEDFEDTFFTARRFEGTLLHQVDVNLLQYYPRHDAQLDSIDDGAPSATALTVGGGQINSSGLAAPLNPQTTFQQYPVSGNDPLQLAGERKCYSRSTNTTSGGVDPDDGGPSVLAYVHGVPLTEFPELGPLFEIGGFDPEGCASTSAGLGDPGVLVITNGSTLPQKFDPQALLIQDAGMPIPFLGEIPSYTLDDIAASPTTGLGLGTYKYRYTFRNCCTGKESNPNPEDIVVDTTPSSPASEVTLSFAGIRIPADPQICEICVYRTVLGGDFPVMAKVGCFNPDETELFVDDVADGELDFTNDGLSLLNAPMPCVPVVVEFQNRLFGLGDIPDLSPDGAVTVVNGSLEVEGDDDVDWNRCLVGKYIHVEGDCRGYEIESIQPPDAGLSPPYNHLRLIEEYEGVSDTDLNYTICGHPNRLFVSEPFEAECWPESSFLDIEPGDGDRLMGAVSNFSRLVICKRHKTYVLTFRENPVLEVASPTRISSDIGCIGPRTFAQVESGSVWLADRGLALYDGRAVQHVPESDKMNSLFVDPDNDRYMRRDHNGRVIGAIGVFYPKREQYLCLIPTKQTDRGANLMVVWDVKLRNVTLYEFCQEFMSLVVAKDADGNERVYMGDTNGFVWILDIGNNDGVGFPNATGTVQGTITDAGVDQIEGASFIDDSTASFITGGIPGLAGLSGVAGLSGSFDENEMGLAGVCVHYRATNADKDEPWQVRTVYAATNTRLYVTPNWAGNAPTDTTYEYMLGAIDFRAIFKPKDYGTQDMLKRNWAHILSYIPEEVATQLRVELLTDMASVDLDEDLVQSGEPPSTGAGRIFDLSFSRGRQVQPVSIDVHSYMQVRLTNFAPEEPRRQSQDPGP